MTLYQIRTALIVAHLGLTFFERLQQKRMRRGTIVDVEIIPPEKDTYEYKKIEAPK